MTDAQVAGGHKANLKNPNTSEESKQHSKDLLENEFSNVDAQKGSNDSAKNPRNVAGGLKATMNNPNVSEEAKGDARERLEAMQS